MQLHRLIYYS